jgi:plasmid stabilization system protein ParE
MASKPLRFHPEAEEEYLASLSWYQQRSPIAATNFETAVGVALETIQKAPQRWPIYFNNFRKYVLRQFPFSVIYQEFSTEVVIFAVAHGSRRPGYWNERVSSAESYE